MRLKITIIFFLSIAFSQAYSQDLLKSKSSELSIGIGLSNADRRYNFLIGRFGGDILRAAKNDNPWFEYDFFLNYSRKILENKKFKVQLGLGYLLNVNLFKLPLNLIYFNDTTEPLWLNEYYYKHNLNLPIEFVYSFKESTSKNLLGILTVNNNFSFYKKSFFGDSSSRSVSKFGLSEVELYGGLKLEKEKYSYALQVRLVNMAMRDDALVNNLKEIDFYNPIKLRMSVSRRF